MLTDALPRVSLAQLPTPLEPLPRLSAALGGPRLWIKRDDQTGLATGGNKARKLEFLVAEALRRGLMIVGGMGGMIDGRAGDHLQITPAFTTTNDQIAEAVSILKDAIRAALKEINKEING